MLFFARPAIATVDLRMVYVDVVEGNITPNREAVAGNPMPVSYVLSNDGTSAAPPFDCEIRFTKTPDSPGNEANIAKTFQLFDWPIPAGGGLGGNFWVNAPTTPGTYYVWMISDPKNSLNQLNTANDIKVSEEPFIVRHPDTVPNLVLKELVLDRKTANPGGTITATWQIVNLGKGPAQGTTTSVRLSEFPKENYGPIVATVAAPAIAAGASATQTATITVPDDVLLGTNYLWLEATGADEIETLQTNPFDDELRSRAIKIVAAISVPPPTILAIKQPSVPPSLYSQKITITGKDFQPGVSLIFDPPSGADIPSNPLKLTYLSTKALEYAFNNANDSGTWILRAKNPDGKMSLPVTIEVTGTTGARIDRVEPDPVLPSLSPQTITIHGSGFLQKAALLFDAPKTKLLKGKPARIVSFSDTKIVYQLNNAADIGPWAVQVQNPGKAPSQPRTFHVGSTSAPTAPENKEILVEAIRLARGSLDAEQEQCIRLVFDRFAEYGDGDTNKLIYLMASIWHESQFRPISENRIDPVVNPTEFARQETYWHTGYFGRGYLQLTHEENYRIYGNAIGVNLLGEVNREDALVPENAAKIAVLGIMAGFTGKPLNTYINAAAQDYMQARLSVNGYVEDQARSVFDKNAAIRATLASLQSAPPALPAMAIESQEMVSVAGAGNTPSLTLLEKRGERIALKYQGPPGRWVQVQHSIDLIHWENNDSFLTPATGEIEVTITPPPQSAQGRIFFRGLVPE